MIRILLAGVCIFALSLPARAQIHVLDDSALVQQIKTYTTEYASYLKQLQQYEQELQTALSTGQLVASTIQNPSLGAVLGLMNMTGLSNDLPVNPNGLMGLSGITSGSSMSFSGLTGKLSMLGSMASTTFNTNHVYTCQDQTFACQQQNQRAYGLAGVSGIAQSAYQDLRNHMAILDGLRERAATATTPAERENVQIALQTEQAWHDNLAGQIQAAQMQATVQGQIDEQRAKEATSQAYQQAIDSIPSTGN